MTSDIERNFGLVWPHHVSNLNQLLIAARQTFGGDLDLFLVLAVIGDRTFSAATADPDLSFDDWQRRAAISAVPRDVNARSIADFTGIPRETVRRKLLLLEEKGWIARNGDGVLQATTRARHDLEPLTRASLGYLDQLFRLFRKVTRN